MTSRFVRSVVIAAGLLAFTALPAASNTVTFDFSGQSVGDTVPLSISSDGLTANFSSPQDAQGFQISSGFYATLGVNYLASPGPDFQTGNDLVIAFSRKIQSITLNFATDTAPDLSLTTDRGGSATASGTIPGGFYFYPEGVLAFSAIYNPFGAITLHSDALSFAVGEITVTTAPEPPALGFAALGFLGVAATRRFHNR